jgi:uncharacterized membrane protein (UPF0127 family)
MIVKNNSSKKIISTNVIEAKNLKDKTLGLIPKSKNQGFFIKTRFGIHTFFMKFPIDILVLEKKGEVMKTKENLKPFRIFVWNPKYNHIVEVPSGRLKKSQTKVGDKVTFNP